LSGAHQRMNGNRTPAARTISPESGTPPGAVRELLPVPPIPRPCKRWRWRAKPAQQTLPRRLNLRTAHIVGNVRERSSTFYFPRSAGLVSSTSKSTGTFSFNATVASKFGISTINRVLLTIRPGDFEYYDGGSIGGREIEYSLSQERYRTRRGFSRWLGGIGFSGGNGKSLFDSGQSAGHKSRGALGIAIRIRLTAPAAIYPF
jgi:hypothetical protein